MSQEPTPPAGEEVEYYYPNLWARLVLVSAEEILGAKGIASLLNQAGVPELIDNYPPENTHKEFPFTQFSRIQGAFWEIFGARGARVFATRAGEQTLTYGLDQFGAVAKAAQAAMQIGSLESRIRVGVQFFAKFFNAVSDQKVHVEEDENYWYWIIERCPMCWQRSASDAQCYLGVGVLQAAAKWASNGVRFRVSPSACIANGDARGVIQIEKPKNE
ncbi:MAG: 4-vinyl reductase [Anaerolineales bacterium]